MKKNLKCTALKDLCNNFKQDIVVGPFGSIRYRRDSSLKNTKY
jgi:hypothetical protein